MRHKFTLTSIDCKSCADYTKQGCSLHFCPYIVTQIADLMDDERFASAVINDEKCTNSHKLTLLRLWSKAIDYDCGLFNGQAIPANTVPTADTSAAMGCYYPADGSTCPNKDKGACFKTWLKENGHAGR